MKTQKFLGVLLLALTSFLIFLFVSGDRKLTPGEFYDKYFPRDTVSDHEIAPESVPEDGEANLSLDELYDQGRVHYEAKNYDSALTLFRKAAERAHPGSQFYLGLIYSNGYGVPEDDVEAIKWYRLSADQGDAYSQNNLGWMLQNGQGASQSDTAAVAWYVKSANQGNANAEANLGWMYENGKGLEKNVDEAARWYRKAADQGFEDGKAGLKRLGK